MLLINYIHPNIIIYADYLIVGDISIVDHKGKQILTKSVNNKTMVQIEISHLTKYQNISVTIKTQKEVLKKSFQKRNIKSKI